MCRTQVYLDSVDEVIVVTSHQSKGFKTSCHLEVRGQTETGILYWFLFRLLHVKSPDCWSSESRSFSSVDVCNFPTLCSSFCFSWTSDFADFWQIVSNRGRCLGGISQLHFLCLCCVWFFFPGSPRSASRAAAVLSLLLWRSHWAQSSPWKISALVRLPSTAETSHGDLTAVESLSSEADESTRENNDKSGLERKEKKWRMIKSRSEGRRKKNPERKIRRRWDQKKSKLLDEWKSGSENQSCQPGCFGKKNSSFSTECVACPCSVLVSSCSCMCECAVIFSFLWLFFLLSASHFRNYASLRDVQPPLDVT